LDPVGAAGKLDAGAIVRIFVLVHPLASVIVAVYVPGARLLNVEAVVTFVKVVVPILIEYGAFPPNGAMVILPFPEQVASTVVTVPFTPALILRDGRVPHFGLIPAVLFNKVAQVLFADASVHAR
jgi:hypothetical protein